MKILLKIFLFLQMLAFAGYAGMGLVAFLWYSGFNYADVESTLTALNVAGTSFSRLVFIAILGSAIYFVRMNMLQAYIANKKVWSYSLWKLLFPIDIVGCSTLLFFHFNILDLVLVLIGWRVFYLYLFKKEEIWKS